MKLSLCITTYNRLDFTLKSFEKVLNDERINEIVIMDDCSTDRSYEELCASLSDHLKIKLFRNEHNLGMSQNKVMAVSKAKNEWCIILDSDNVIDTTYIDAIDRCTLLADTIYMPEAALPNFNFKHLSSLIVDKRNVSRYMVDPLFRTCLNACNYVVNREIYMQTYKYDPSIKATDTIHHNFNHLKAGGLFYIVPGMTYMHLVHPGSGFVKDMDYNMKKAMEMENKIRTL